MADEEVATANELFDKIDTDRDGHLDVHEVVMLFQQLAPDQSTDSACNAAAEALLMVDANSDRRLSKQEFQQLLHKIANIGGLSVAEAARKLLNSLEQHSDLAAEVLEQATQNLQTDYPRHRNSNTTNNTSITTTAAAATIAAEKAASKQGPAAVPPSRMSIHQLVMDDRMLQLFRLWDKAGIGAVCFQELCLGIARFRPIHDKEDVLHTMTEAASVLALHSNNSSMQLDLETFAIFMSRFMAAAGYDLDDVLDQLITLAATKPDDKKLLKVLDAASSQIQKLLTPQQEQQVKRSPGAL